MWCVYPATSSWLKQFILCGPAQKWRHSGTTCPGPEPGLCQERQVPIWTPAWNSTWFWTSVEKEHQRPAISSCCSKGPAKRLMGRNVTFNDWSFYFKMKDRSVWNKSPPLQVSSEMLVKETFLYTLSLWALFRLKRNENQLETRSCVYLLKLQLNTRVHIQGKF